MGTKINNTNMNIDILMNYMDGGWKEIVFRQLITDKYKNTCQKCGIIDDSNHIHHIKHRVDYPELEYIEDNVTLLCYKCHKKEHAKVEIKKPKTFKVIINEDTLDIIHRTRTSTGKSWDDFFKTIIRKFK